MLTTLFALLSLSCQTVIPTDTLWNKDFQSAQEIVTVYNKIQEHVGTDSDAGTLGLCNYVWKSGEYMFRCRGANDDIAELAQYAGTLELDDPVVMTFMEQHGIERFTDHYFTLQAMKQGDSFDNARDGLTATVYFPIRAINSNDYNKLREVFSCNNDTLHKVFLAKLKFPITNSGCTREFSEIRDLIIENVADSDIKTEILSLFEQYENILPGKPSPQATLKDTAGVAHTLDEFRGKVLVIDVWATWCSSCLKKFPAYMELHNKYANSDEIEFITISIDRSNKKEHWKNTLLRFGLEGLTNLFPDCEEESPFESQYHISGIPRYIVIDQAGNIVTAYAPPPGEGLENIIAEILTQNKNKNNE